MMKNSILFNSKKHNVTLIGLWKNVEAENTHKYLWLKKY